MLTAASRQFAASTHLGLKRNRNEDCYEAAPELGLWLIADGVGGHSCGDIASDIVRSTIKDCIVAGKTLSAAVVQSHSAVLQAMEQDKTTNGMGSTVVALLIKGNDYEVCWVGDSRAYLWHTELHQITEDHTRASELLASEIITVQQAATHPERHVLTQSLGVSENMTLAPGRTTGTLLDGQQILLCSDGLYDEISSNTISRVLSEQGTPQGQVDALIQTALDAGGNDNITVVVVGNVDTAPTVTNSPDLEQTHDTVRPAGREQSRKGGFPFKALLLLSAAALLALWWLT